MPVSADTLGAQTDSLPVTLPHPGDTLDWHQVLSARGLQDVQLLDSSIQVELKYATEDNFLGRNVYGSLTRCFLQPEVAHMLIEAQRHVKAHDPRLSLLVFDGVRPRSVQIKMWEIVKDTPAEKYVAHPFPGSNHNFGAAVDLGLIHLDTGWVDMGTPFDYFGDLAQPRFEVAFLQSGELTPQQGKNRQILRQSMRKAGFVGILSEWWHFNAFSKEEAREKFQIVE